MLRHGRRRALKHDCERYNAFVVGDRLVARFSFEHVMLEPRYVQGVLDQCLECQRERLAWVVRRGVRPAMADDKLSKGDQVEWSSHGNKTEGKVKKKITSETEAGGRKVKASKDEPQYLVKSDKSGGEAVHKPGALKKKKK